MRNMSFIHTKEQMRARTKTVTRRREHTWKFLKVGDQLQAVERTQGIPKGGHVVPLAVIEVVSVSVERLCFITQAEVNAEGFPEMTKEDFIEFFCRTFKCSPDAFVRRIEFKYIEENE